MDNETKSGSQFGAYTPRRYYREEYYAIDPAADHFAVRFSGHSCQDIPRSTESTAILEEQT